MYFETRCGSRLMEKMFYKESTLGAFCHASALPVCQANEAYSPPCASLLHRGWKRYYMQLDVCTQIVANSLA